MSIVVIKGTEGLGNRLLSLEFALRFAHNRQYAVEIDWSDPVYMVDKDCFVKHFELIGIELGSVDRKNPGICYPPALAKHLDDDIMLVLQGAISSQNPSSIALWRKKKLVGKQDREGVWHETFFLRRTPSFDST